MAKDKLKALSKQRKWAHQKFLSLGSTTYQGFLQMEQATYCDGALSKKQKELIAIGISVTIDCASCMQWHIHQALQAGAAEDQVLEAIEVGIEMGGGPATVSSRFALKVLENYGAG